MWHLIGIFFYPLQCTEYVPFVDPFWPHCSSFIKVILNFSKFICTDLIYTSETVSVSIVNSFPSDVRNFFSTSLSVLIPDLCTAAKKMALWPHLPVQKPTKKWYLVTTYQFSSSQKKWHLGHFLKLLYDCTVKTKGLPYIIATAQIFLSNHPSIFSFVSRNLAENMAAPVWNAVDVQLFL